MTPEPAMAPGGIRESASRRFCDRSRPVSPPRRLADSWAIALALLSTFILQSSTLAQGTAFTYQGKLTSGGNPATGSYDLKFSLFDALGGGSLVGTSVTSAGVGVTNGYFIVTLDFGSVFNGNARWLEIAVRTNGGGAFSPLAPRQPLTAAPYALYAPNAGTAGTVTTVPLGALPASVPWLDTNLQMTITGDLSVAAPAPLLAEGFEGATFPPAAWTSGGTTAWARATNVCSEGAASAGSGTIGDNQISYFQLSCNAPASALVKFDWKVDSEITYDFLQVFVDGTFQSSISGSVNWTPVTLPVSAGTHTIRWVYAKDVTLSVGQDRGWIDNVRLVVATGTLTTEALSVNGQLTVSGQTYFPTNVGIGTVNPMRLLQIGDAGVYGSQGWLRMASRSTNSGDNRIWDVGVPQTGADLTGVGYSFVIDDTQLGTDPEFIVHWGNGRVGIGRTNPVSALDVNGTVTATAFAGNASGLTNLSAANVTGTIPDTRLSTNVALVNAPQVFTSSNYFAGVAALTNAANTLAGDGSALVNLNLNRARGNMLTIGRDWGDGPFQVLGSTWIVDQQQPSFGYYFFRYSVWQSFTAGTNGNLAALQAWVYSRLGGPWSATLRVYAGEGTAGALLSSQPIAGDGVVQERTFALETPVPVTESNQYTFSIQNATVQLTIRGSGDAYAGGRSDYGTGYDYHFHTWMSNQVEVPVLVVQPNTLYVGIGKANPTTVLDVNGTVTATSFAGNGAELTNLNAARITGTLPVGSLLPAGTMLVSTLPNDPALVTNGLTPMMTVPAPAWVNGATSNMPSARSGHTAVWDGHRFIIWGGTVGTGIPVNSGSVYYPDDNLWDEVSTIEAPGARVSHTAVWTGSEMLVWGGGGASGFLNTGGRFQPSPQGWQTISTNGAPAERGGHIAVWTGGRMFIWGGVNASGLLNDGALYNPVSNHWTTLALPGAPAARRGATAVWAGDRVLIWGGEGTNGVLNSGAQLTFSAGTTPVQWSPMNLTNAPTARRWHTAIWTGQKMLVWGGENAGVPLGDGAAFDPVANAWETVSSSGAPVARFNHAAVWTGQEMLIVAGSTGSTELNSGAAYDPATARWRTLSSAGNPQARTGTTAAWTGTEVLIFGGEAQGQCVAALQRLVPQPAWYFYRKL